VAGQVTLWLSWSPEELAMLADLLGTFTRQFPGVQVSVIYWPPEQLLDRYLESLENGEPPTALIGPSLWGPSLYEAQAIRALTDRLEPDQLSSLRPLALEETRYSTDIIALPLSVQGVVLYRNRELAQEPPPTLAFMVDLAAAAKEEDAAVVWLDFSFASIGASMQACSLSLLDTRGEPQIPAEETACWFEMLRHWSQAGPVTYGGDEDELAFMNGQAAWVLASTERVDDFLEALGPDGLAVDPWPLYQETGKAIAGFATTEAIYFSRAAGERDYEAAWVLARYLLSPEAQGAMMASPGGRKIPALQRVVVETPWMEQMLVALDGNVRPLRVPAPGFWAELFDPEIRPAVIGNVNIDFAIRRLQARLEQALRRLR
jgi:ABC-type glycerol-3-phosphate transport system substrate-binding protein